MLVLKAIDADVPALNELVNFAYRGELSKKGWTSEADLFDGNRIDELTLATYFKNPAVTILKHVDVNGLVTGAVYLEQRPGNLYLGMLSVNPHLQDKGIGRLLLSSAEEFAREEGFTTIRMTVITTRTELISWYLRRGYIDTGERQAFSYHKKFGSPRQPIALSVLEKKL